MPGGSKGGESSGVSAVEITITAEHAFHVVLGFGEGRNAAVFLHIAFTGVVGGEGQFQVVVIAVDQVLDVLCAGPDVFSRVVGIIHAVHTCSGGHELHQALSAGLGAGAGVEAGLGVYDGFDEAVINILGQRKFLDDVIKGIAVLAEAGAYSELACSPVAIFVDIGVLEPGDPFKLGILPEAFTLRLFARVDDIGEKDITVRILELVDVTGHHGGRSCREQEKAGKDE